MDDEGEQLLEVEKENLLFDLEKKDFEHRLHAYKENIIFPYWLTISLLSSSILNILLLFFIIFLIFGKHSIDLSKTNSSGDFF